MCFIDNFVFDAIVYCFSLKIGNYPPPPLQSVRIGPILELIGGWLMVILTEAAGSETLCTRPLGLPPASNTFTKLLEIILYLLLFSYFKGN